MPGRRERAAQLGLEARLNLNFLPQGLLHSNTALMTAVEAAHRCGVPVDALCMEATETEVIDDTARFKVAVNELHALGVQVAIDDFGAGYSGLNLLADFQPDQIKLDMNLVRGIDARGARQSIVRAIIQVCVELGIDVVAEGSRRWRNTCGSSTTGSAISRATCSPGRHSKRLPPCRPAAGRTSAPATKPSG